MLAEVLVDVSVWGLDKPLTYEVPEKLRDAVRVGSVVRVPLRNRRVRGWVTSVGEGDTPGLAALLSITGPEPVIDDQLLKLTDTLARRYLHPRSSFLGLFTPPQAGRGLKPGVHDAQQPSIPDQRFTLRRLAHGESASQIYAELIEEQLAAGSGAIVAVPEIRDGSEVLESLASRFADRAAVVHSGATPKDRSRALWEVAAGNKKVVLGGRAALFAPAFRHGLIIIHHEEDVSFKEQRSPYYDARIVGLERAKVTGSSLMLASPTPSLLSLSKAGSDWELVEPPRHGPRTWPFVEILPPSRMSMPQRAVAALIESYRSGHRTVVMLPRKDSTRAGLGVHRMVEYISRVVPEATIARADRGGIDEAGIAEVSAADVVVGTEAILSDAPQSRVGAAIALDVDVYLNRPKGRSVEDAFASLWQLGGLAAWNGFRGRLLLETASADHHVPQALTRGDYGFFARHELANRKDAEAPPFVTMVRLTSRADPTPVADSLEQLPDVTVLGPAEAERGWEILLKVKDLEQVLDPLDTIVRRGEGKIFVEVDPRDW